MMGLLACPAARFTSFWEDAECLRRGPKFIVDAAEGRNGRIAGPLGFGPAFGGELLVDAAMTHFPELSFNVAGRARTAVYP